MPDLDRRTMSLLALASALSPPRALAQQAYPSRPVHTIVGFTPGASSDIVARIFAQGAGPLLNQEVVVENKPGASSAIAADYVTRAAEDGYTLLLAALSTLTNKIVHPNAKYDMVKDYAPIALLATGAIVMAIDPKLDVHSVADFTAMAKAKPGEVLFGTVGPGSLPDFAAELYAQRAGVKIVQVSYPGSPQVTQDMLAGRVMMSFQIASSVIGQIKAGQIRALAVAGNERSDLLPDVPTMAEAGMPDFNTPLWFGLLAPVGTPRPIIDKLAAVATRAMHTPDAVDLLHKQGFRPEQMGPDQFGAYIKSETARWSAVAKAARMKA